MRAFMRKATDLFLCLAFWTLTFSGLVFAEDSATLKKQLNPFLEVLKSSERPYSVEGEVTFPADGKSQKLNLEINRINSHSFDLVVENEEYAISIHRRENETVLMLPKHKIAYASKGDVSTQDHLDLDGIINRLISNQSTLAVAKPLLQSLDADAISFTLSNLAKLSWDAGSKSWNVGDDVRVQIDNEAKTIDAKADDVIVSLKIVAADSLPTEISIPDDFKKEDISREQLERHLCRGVRRATEILAPGAALTDPSEKPRKVEHGELRWVDHHRVVLLKGTPEQIGKAHGQLLKNECQRCIDSVLYTFGLAQTIQTGRWFPEDLRKAYERLSPHIPERHKVETRALAVSLGMETELLETLNVFPELFHCSGFALFGNATVDGTMYHGRVLDYMTAIGLQDAATTFIVSVDDKIPFANVGYAGFIGSVSGMNAKKISLGEMGGRGEGKWDGVPMATLMRRALEECDSLDDVVTLWKESPRTCEYYYVFADGNNKSAVGVAATPEKLELVNPGDSHELLGEGVKDTVILSAGSRLELLRKRIQENYGKIDETIATRLMDRPVAMESNLHNVLFVPEKGILLVANASHKQPAAERPYIRIELNAMLQSFKPSENVASKAIGAKSSTTSAPTTKPVAAKPLFGATFTSADTLSIGEERSADAAECLSGLTWAPGKFTVVCREPWRENGDALVSFKSPLPIGKANVDEVSLEWYQAKNKNNEVVKAPAVVVVHESGSGMTVGRLIAKQLSDLGLHAFMIHLPFYGTRRGEEGRPGGAQLFGAIRQAIADVRRARDAVAALPQVDANNISLQGTSLGGFVSATSGALDKGYHSVFIMLAGGGLYDVIKNGERDAAKLRQELEEKNVTEDQLKSVLNAIEPLRLAHRLNPNRTWVYSGSFDNVVPPRSSKLLVEAAHLDKDHHVEMLADHYSGIVYLPFILNHMRNRVEELPASPR
jgi:hypothetical protein